MAAFLIEHGIAEDDLAVEERSRTTHENAVESAHLLHKRGIGKESEAEIRLADRHLSSKSATSGKWSDP